MCKRGRCGGGADAAEVRAENQEVELGIDLAAEGEAEKAGGTASTHCRPSGARGGRGSWASC